MGLIKINQSRDFEYTVFLKDKDGQPLSIVGQTFVQVKMKNTDATILRLTSPLVAKVNEIQTITFDDDPTGGTFTLDFGGGNITAAINWNDSAATVTTKINALAIFSAVVVTGTIDQATGLTITYGGDDGGRDQPLPIVADSLTPALTTTALETTKGVAESGVDVVSEARGEIKIKGSEVQASALLLGDGQTTVFVVRIADKDLNIPPQKNFHDVDADPLA